MSSPAEKIEWTIYAVIVIGLLIWLVGFLLFGCVSTGPTVDLCGIINEAISVNLKIMMGSKDFETVKTAWENSQGLALLAIEYGCKCDE